MKSEGRRIREVSDNNQIRLKIYNRLLRLLSVYLSDSSLFRFHYILLSLPEGKDLYLY